MHLALILAFITFFGWGTGDLFTIFAVRRVGASLATFWIFSFSFLLSLIALPFVPHNFSLITLPLLAVNILLGILFISGNVLVSEAFRISKAPIIGIIVPSVPAIVLILSVLFFHDKITFYQILSILFVISGISLCGFDFQQFKKTKKIFDKGVLLALLAIIFFALFFTFSRALINAYGWYLPTFIATACYPVIILFIKWQKEKIVIPKMKKVLLATLIVALLIRAGDFAFNYGISLHNATGIVTPIANSAPILFVITSYLVYKDKITRQQLLGIVITLFGLFLLTILD